MGSRVYVLSKADGAYSTIITSTTRDNKLYVFLFNLFVMYYSSKGKHSTSYRPTVTIAFTGGSTPYRPIRFMTGLIRDLCDGQPTVRS
jgi:hypothetical protein